MRMQKNPVLSAIMALAIAMSELHCLARTASVRPADPEWRRC